MYINRFLENEINKYIKRKEIIAIVGPRQSGKTTLLKYIFKDLKNGITLCRDCHKKFHKIYGKKNNNKGQVEEFIN